jgi:RNA polymerase sigma factor (sigma-70 family)
LEASALTHASQRGLLARRSPLLKLQGDEKLIAMARGGNPGAFEAIVDRYQGRLLGFCRQMLKSTEDAEDVLQEVFVNAYRAMLADEREINLRPWLYRIARNRCLNHLRKPTADAQESMDMVPAVEASSTAEKVHNREEFRQLLTDVSKLPETQRSALLLREIDALSYEEIAEAMDTSVPSVKSLLVRARISLAEASQARQLTCGEVRLELAEASEGLRKVSGPVRRHVRVCEECADFRSQVRSNDKVLAALFPVGPLLAFKGFIASKLGLAGSGGGATAAGAGATGAGAVGSVGGGLGAAIGGSGAAGGIGAIGGAIGTKAVAGVVTAAVLTAGAAVEVKQQTEPVSASRPATISRIVAHKPAKKVSLAQAQVSQPPAQPTAPAPVAEPAPAPVEPDAVPTESTPAPSAETPSGDPADQSNAGNGASGVTDATPSGPSGSSGSTVVVTVGGPSSTTTPPPSPPPPSPSTTTSTEETPPPPPPSESGTTSTSTSPASEPG